MTMQRVHAHDCSGPTGFVHGVPFFLLLVGIGLAVNYLRYEVFFSIEFIFGSIFAMLALQFFGLRWGVLAAGIISLVTYHLWNHPYAVVIMTAEVAVVGLLKERRGIGLVVADALYWVAFGIPLVVLFYYGVMHLPFYSAAVTMMKQALNGIANTLVARLIFMVAVYGRKNESFSLRELIFSLLTLFVLVPSLFLIALESHTELGRTQAAVHKALTLNVQRTVSSVEEWLRSHLKTVEHLAWVSASQPLPMVQGELDHVRGSDPAFLRMGLLDRSATIVAYSPLIDELGQKNIGKNFADRPFIPRLKQTLKPMLSEVVMGRIGRPKPMVTALAPVVKRGAYAGYVTGILDLDKVQQMITVSMQSASLPEVQFILLDRNGRVIVSSRGELTTLEPFQRTGGERIDQGDGVFQWVPHNVKNVSTSDRWKKALYTAEGGLGGSAEWTLILEQPLAPFQKQLYEHFAAQLSWTFVILLGAIALAETASRGFVRSLDEVRAISTDIPAKISSGAAIAWPESVIKETSALVENFSVMARTLVQHFRAVQGMNVELERRVEDRTRQLRESEERFRFIYERSPLGMGFMTPAGVITGCNDMLSRIIGSPREKIVGFNMKDNVVDPAMRHAVAEALSGRIGVYEGRYVTQTSGKSTYLRSIYAPLIAQNGSVGEILFLSEDITERKRAEVLTKESHERMLTVLNGLDASVYVADMKTYELLFVNNYIKHIFGDIIGQTCWKTLQAGQSGPCAFCTNDMLLNADGKPAGIHHWEFQNTADGHWYDIRDRALPWVDGRVVRMEISIDVTERKRAEEKVRQLANEQQTILDTVAVGVAFVKNRKLLWANPAFERIFGRGPGEARGLDVREIYANAEDYERIGREGYRLINAGGVYTTQVRSVRKDGETFWLNLTGRAVNPDDSAEGSIWMMQDVTERKATEEALRANEQLFRESIEFMPMPIGIADADGTIRRYNKSFVETYGYSVRDVPTIDAWLQTVFPDDAYREQCRRMWESDVRRAVAEQGSTPTREYEVVCKNGRVKSVEITMRPIGSLFIATFYDVTARRRVEKDLVEKTLQLEDLTRDLECRVKQEVELRRSNEQILVQQSKMAAMGEMLGAIAHQWRQPLNTLGLIIQNFKDAHAFGELRAETIEQTVQKSMSQIRHMSKTIDDFRSFFQPDKERSTFDTMQAVGDVISLFSAQLSASSIDFRLACRTHGGSFSRLEDIAPCRGKSVSGFRNEFEHVIMNLVNNAREAIIERRERGSMPERERGLISFEFRNAGEKIIIEVSDNGGGIPEDVIGRVFEPYFTTKDPAKGTGLGLYMTAVIVNDHMRGRVTATNRGQGALFTIELPQA